MSASLSVHAGAGSLLNRNFCLFGSIRLWKELGARAWVVNFLHGRSASVDLHSFVATKSSQACTRGKEAPAADCTTLAASFEKELPALNSLTNSLIKQARMVDFANDPVQLPLHGGTTNFSTTWPVSEPTCPGPLSAVCSAIPVAS